MDGDGRLKQSCEEVVLIEASNTLHYFKPYSADWEQDQFGQFHNSQCNLRLRVTIFLINLQYFYMILFPDLRILYSSSVLGVETRAQLSCIPGSLHVAAFSPLNCSTYEQNFSLGVKNVYLISCFPNKSTLLSLCILSWVPISMTWKQ